jgi:probable O-glycosylation ligase (exosortase A-associated)
MRLILFLAVLGPALLFGLANRFAALLVYIGFAMFRPQEWVWADITWLRLSVVSGLVLVGPSLLSGVFPNVTHPLSIGMIAWLAGALLGQANAVSADTGWLWLGSMARMILVCLLAIPILNTRRRILIATTVFSSAVALHASKAALAMLLTGRMRLQQGFGGSFGDNNLYALVVVMVLPFLVLTVQNFQTIRGNFPAVLVWGWRLAVPLCIVTVLGTYSRGGALALCAAAAVFLALQRRKFVGLLVLAVLASGALWFASNLPGYRERLNTVSVDTQEASATGRLHFWRVAIDIARDWPLGIGLRNFEWMYDRYDFSHGAYGRGRAVHNSHLQVLVETGWFGLFVWVCLFGYAFLTAFRLRRASKDLARPPDERHFSFTLGNALLASMTGFLVGGTFLSMAMNDATWYTFAFAAAADRLRRLPVPAPSLAPELAPVRPVPVSTGPRFRRPDPQPVRSTLQAGGK